MLIPGGFGSRGWGEILACRVARERGILPGHLPRYARRRLGVRAPRRRLDGANSTEMDRRRPYPVIDLFGAKEIEDLGGTMHLGAQAVELVEGTARDATVTGRPRAAPSPLRGEQPLPAGS